MSNLRDMLGEVVRKLVDLPILMLVVVFELVKRLWGEDKEEWFVELKKFICKEKCWTWKVQVNSNFQVWKTIEIGTYKSIPEIRKALRASGFKVPRWGNTVLNKIALSPEKAKVELVATTVAELGYKDGARYKDIVNRIQELGFGICPAEVGPQLRLQYPDQPRHEWMIVVMDPIVILSSQLEIFSIAHDSTGRKLKSHYGNQEYSWNPDTRLVFMRHRE